MVEFGENVQGLVPGEMGCVEIPGDAVVVADAGKHVSLVVAVPALPADVQRLVVAGCGLLEPTQMVVGVADGVPYGGLLAAVTEFLVKGEGLVAMVEGLLVVAEEGMAPTDRVERLGFPMPVAGGPVKV